MSAALWKGSIRPNHRVSWSTEEGRHESASPGCGCGHVCRRCVRLRRHPDTTEDSRRASDGPDTARGVASVHSARSEQRSEAARRAASELDGRARDDGQADHRLRRRRGRPRDPDDRRRREDRARLDAPRRKALAAPRPARRPRARRDQGQVEGASARAGRQGRRASHREVLGRHANRAALDRRDAGRQDRPRRERLGARALRLQRRPPREEERDGARS